MKRTETLGIVRFHSILRTYIMNIAIRGRQGDGAQETIYGSLFRWAYEKADAGVPPESINRWLKGRESVNRSILKAAMAAPVEECKKYSQVFEKFMKKNIFSSPSMLSSDLIEALKADKLQDTNQLNMAKACDIMAVALVAALANDGIRKEIKVRGSIMEAFDNAAAICKKKDNPFHTPYALDVLLTEQDGLLLRALNLLEPGLGNHYRERIRGYTERTAHRGSYVEEKLEDELFIFYARKYAFLDRRKEANEIDLIRGLFLTDSKTMQKLRTIVGDENNLLDIMRQLAAAGSETTTIPLGNDFHRGETL